MTTTTPPLAETIDRAKREVLEDVSAGRVPCEVGSFAELHDHVDANGYGGAFEWFGSHGTDDEAMVDADCRFWNQVQDAVDAWIKAGALLDPKSYEVLPARD